MKSLYIASISSHAGKSLVSLILGIKMKSEGLKVGYIKPIGTLPAKVRGVSTDEDALFIARALEGTKDLDIPVNILCPVLMDAKLSSVEPGEVDARDAQSTKDDSLKARILSAFSQVSSEKDVVIVGGVGTLSAGSMIDLSGPKLADLMDARMLLVYSNSIPLRI